MTGIPLYCKKNTTAMKLLEKYFKPMRTIAVVTLLALMMAQAYSQTSKKEKSKQMKTTEQTDHYTFQLTDKVTRQKVTFKNRYGIVIAADLYLPKNHGNEPMAALAISGPFGAVKEQSSGLYAQNMAERGFVTLAFDPSYTGE